MGILRIVAYSLLIDLFNLCFNLYSHLAMGQNLVRLVNIKIAGKWVFTPLTLIIVGFDTHPFVAYFALHLR